MEVTKRQRPAALPEAPRIMAVWPTGRGHNLQYETYSFKLGWDLCAPERRQGWVEAVIEMITADLKRRDVQLSTVQWEMLWPLSTVSAGAAVADATSSSS